LTPRGTPAIREVSIARSLRRPEQGQVQAENVLATMYSDEKEEDNEQMYSVVHAHGAARVEIKDQRESNLHIRIHFFCD
jgi:hypothetical protein